MLNLTRVFVRGKRMIIMSGTMGHREVSETLETDCIEDAQAYRDDKEAGFPFSFDFWVSLEATRV